MPEPQPLTPGQELFAQAMEEVRAYVAVEEEHRYVQPVAAFLKVVMRENAQPLPVEVWQAICDTIKLMGSESMEEVASNFENSVIVIGHTPETEADALEHYCGPGDERYWPNVQGGKPVAHWRSGISTGCDQELFLMPDGTFEWTEP